MNINLYILVVTMVIFFVLTFTIGGKKVIEKSQTLPSGKAQEHCSSLCFKNNKNDNKKTENI